MFWKDLVLKLTKNMLLQLCVLDEVTGISSVTRHTTTAVFCLLPTRARNKSTRLYFVYSMRKQRSICGSVPSSIMDSSDCDVQSKATRLARTSSAWARVSGIGEW